MSQQIDLLFGVAGGGDPKGASGRKIKNQIENIVNNINASNGGPAYKIKNIEISQASLNKIKSQIESLNVSLKNIQVAGVTAGGSKSNSTPKNKELSIQQEEELAWKQFEKEQKRIQHADAQMSNMHQKKIEQELKETATVEQETAKQIAAYNKLEDAREKKAKQASVDRLKLEQNEEISREKIFNKVLKSYNSFSNIKDYPLLDKRYSNLIEELGKKTTLTAEEARHFTKVLNRLENDAYETGVACDTLGEAIEHKISDRIKYLIGQFAIDFVVQGLRRVYDNVVQIDTAMTELKKVTDETDESYDRFLTNAGKRAKELGATLVEVVQVTSDYARLGYSVDEASKLADAAIVYTNVGDGLRDTNEATDHIISTMKAFGIEAENSMRIIDAFNEVSNNFAVTSSDIGAGLQRSSAAMAAAGNSMEETIALFTAGNTIIRDADSMGTSLKTMSMRLRSSKSDLEALGEDTDGAAESISSLRKEIKALTGVDIMINDTTYKNTYQILQDISKEWEHLNDITRANVLELLFGKRQANVGAAIIENFDIAEDVLEKATNSAGSAMAENEKYLESIQGHLDQLTASFQVLSSNVLDSELVKFGVDFLKTVLDLLNGIFEASHLLGDALGYICEPLGQIVNLFGTLTVIASGAALLDGLFGFKHVNNVLNVVAAAKDYLKILKQVQAVSMAANTSDVISKVVGKVLESPDTKYNKETMKGVAKVVEKIKGAFDRVKNAAAETGGAIGGFGSKASLAIGAIPIALAVAIAWFGIAYTKSRSLEEQTKKLAEAQNEYNGTVDELENLNNKLEENKDRIKELQGLEKPSPVEQEELLRLEAENKLLEKQIELQKQLVELKRLEYHDTAQDTFEKTAGKTKYGNNVHAQYYSQWQGDYYKAEVDEWQKKLDNAKKLAAEGKDIDISWYESELAERQSEYLTWQQDVITLAGQFADATRAEHIATRDTLNGIINGFTYDSSEFSGMESLLGDARFTKIIDFLQNHSEIKDFDQLTYRLAESFGVIFEPGSVQAFKSAVEDAGYTIDDVVGSINQLENPEEIVISVSTEELDAAKESIKSLSSSCKTMSEAFKEQNENGSLSVDTILDIMEAGYGAALAVDAETGAVRINASEYRRLAQDKFDAAKKTWENILASHKAALAQYEEAKAAGTLAEVYGSLANAEIAAAAAKNGIIEAEAALASFANTDLSKVISGLYGVGNAASDAKSKLSKLQSGMENLLSQTISWLKQEYSSAQEAQERYYNSQIDALEDAKDAAKDRWDAEKEAIEDAKDSYNDLIDAQIELLKRQKEADDYAKSKAEKEDAVADIENQLLAIENDDSIEAQKMRLELQEQLKEAKDELDELQADREYELREQALQDEKDRYNDEVDAKLDAIEKQSEAEQKAYQDRIDRLRKYLDAVRDAERTEAEWRSLAYDWIENREEELYQNLIEWNRIYGVTTLPLSGNRHRITTHICR